MRMKIVRPKTIPRAISSHRRSRAAARRLDNYCRAPWIVVIFPVLQLVRCFEQDALRSLIELEPVHQSEAREKLLYLFAALASNAATLPPCEVQRVLETLRPFRQHLAGTLDRAHLAGRQQSSSLE